MESEPQAYSDIERRIAEQLFEENYALLTRLARQGRRRAGFAHTLQTSDVLHEAFLKLAGSSPWRTREHFFSIVVLAVRQVIIDHARRRLADKRGGGAPAASIDDVDAIGDVFAESPAEIVEIADLLSQLETVNPRWMRIVDARYFAGLTEAEAAAALGLSERTVRREWRAARDWLAEKMDVA